jgi:hypothetical protein
MIYLYVFEFFEVIELCNISSTCQKFKIISQDEYLWKLICERRGLVKYKNSWRNTYSIFGSWRFADLPKKFKIQLTDRLDHQHWLNVTSLTSDNYFQFYEPITSGKWIFEVFIEKRIFELAVGFYHGKKFETRDPEYNENWFGWYEGGASSNMIANRKRILQRESVVDQSLIQVFIHIEKQTLEVRLNGKIHMKEMKLKKFPKCVIPSVFMGKRLTSIFVTSPRRIF